MINLSERKLFSSANILLLSILIIGFIVRVWGINFGLPYLYHPDEFHFVQIPFDFVKTGDLNPHYFHKPTLLIYMLYFLYLPIIFLRPELISLEVPQPLFFLIGRIFCAFLGGLTVFLLYILGKTAFSKKVGLISALFLCFAFLHANNSHYIAVDVPMTFFIMLSFIFIYKGYLHGKIKDFIYAGIFGGLAASTKYPAAVISVSIFFANFFYVINNKIKKREILLGKRLILSAISMIFAFLVASPFIVLDYFEFKSDFFSQAFHMKEGHFGYGAEVPNHWIYHLTNTLPQEMGLILCLFSLVAVVYILLYRRKQNGIFLLIFPITFYLLISSFKTLFHRYAIPLIPFLTLFAGYFFVEIINKLDFKRKRWGKIIGVILIISLIGGSAIKLFYQDWLFTREDTRTQGKKWIEENIPEGSKIEFVHFFANGPQLGIVDELILEESKYRKRKYKIYISKNAEKRYNISILSDESFTKKSTCSDYVSLSSNFLRRIFKYPENYPMGLNQYEIFIKHAQLLKAFSPYRNPKEDRWFIPNETLFCRIYPGPLIKVYKVKNKDSLMDSLKKMKQEF